MDSTLLSLSVDRDDHRPIFMQIYDDLRDRILSGRLHAGALLPPSRILAQELRVSRSTVTTAYEQLVSEGYAQGRRGSGLYVCDLPEESLQVDVAPAIVRFAGKPAGRAPDKPVPFRTGEPDMRLFPYQDWARAVARIARTEPESLILSSEPFGCIRLRHALSRHLAEWRGFEADPARIIITAGAAGALDLVLRTLTRQGDRIALEEPGYPPLRHIAESLGLDCLPLAISDDGAETDALDRFVDEIGTGARQGTSAGISGTGGAPPKLIFLTPSHQFPLGGAMPLARRIEFLRIADAIGAHIVEDDFDSEFRYAGRPIPAMTGLSRSDRVFYVGSLSKIFAAPLRLGYLVVPTDMIARFRKTLSVFGSGASVMPQRPLAEFIDSGDFHRHIRRMRRIYDGRRRVFFQLLQDNLAPFVTWKDHQAGMTVLMRLPDGTDDNAIVETARKAGISLRPASEFYAAGRREAGLLAGFSAFQPQEMDHPMQELAGILAAFSERTG